jgi:uroporphyrinogen-III synthase
MRVAVFRALDDGRRTGQRLADRGHEAVLAPVLIIEPTGQSLPQEQFDAVVLTSAHAVGAVRDGFGPFTSVPCFCVGPRTAQKATRAGFSQVHEADGDAPSLAAAVALAYANPANILFVTGRERKPTIEQALGAAGHFIRVVESYSAAAVETWPAEAIEGLRASLDAALHFSTRSARLALALAEKAGLDESFRSVRHHCLSADVAGALNQGGFRETVIGARPTEEALLDSLDSGCSDSQGFKPSR